MRQAELQSSLLIRRLQAQHVSSTASTNQKKARRHATAADATRSIEKDVCATNGSDPFSGPSKQDTFFTVTSPVGAASATSSSSPSVNGDAAASVSRLNSLETQTASPADVIKVDYEVGSHSSNSSQPNGFPSNGHLAPVTQLDQDISVSPMSLTSQPIFNNETEAVSPKSTAAEGRLNNSLTA